MPGKRLNTHSATVSMQMKIESVPCFGIWECNVILVIVSVMIIFFLWGSPLGFTGGVT